MAVLVTGGAGFIGSHLIERLLARDRATQVICLDNFNDYYDPRLKRANVARFAGDPRVVVVERTFCDAHAVRHLLDLYQVRHIVHLGAYAGVRASLEAPQLYEENNVRGTLAMLEAARSLPIERFLLVSSSTVYGPDVPVPFREDALLGTPLSPYGASKLAAELIGAQYLAAYGVPVVSLRPFSVYGPRMRPDLAMRVFAENILAGKPVPLYGNGEIRRDFTHVSDICDGMLAALEADGVIGQAINLGHHEPASIRHLLELIEDALGRKAVIEEHPGLSLDLPVTCADLPKAARLLGYHPKVALADGVRDFVAWLVSTKTP